MIDIEKFICSLLADHPEGITVRGDIHRALKEQGLEYKDGKIVPIEDKTELKESEDERIRKMIISTLNRDKILTEDEAYDCVAWIEKQGERISANSCKTCKDEQKPIERKDFISIPFGTDSEFIKEAIAIPDGCVATIEGNRIHIRKK